MSSVNTYTAAGGEDWATVSRRAFGLDSYASLIAQANPGVATPLTPGQEILVPELTGTQIRYPDTSVAHSGYNAAVNDREEVVSIFVDGKPIPRWSSVEISKSLDKADTFSVRGTWDPENDDDRELYRPFSYKDFLIQEEGANTTPLLSGVVINNLPTGDADNNLIVVSGYANSGVLEDCSAPASALPLEFSDTKVDIIAKKFCDIFGIPLYVVGDVGATFSRVKLKTNENMMGFLAKLCAQRSVVIGSSADGGLTLTQRHFTDTPVAYLREGHPPLGKISPMFHPRKMYSHVTGITPSKIGASGQQFTGKNTHLRNTLRPHTFVAKDTSTGGDIKTAVQTKASRMFANAVTYEVPLTTWRDGRGKIWEPGTTVVINSPKAMIYGDYEFTIRSVRLLRSNKAKSATLTVTPLGGMFGEIPANLPWISKTANIDAERAFEPVIGERDQWQAQSQK